MSNLKQASTDISEDSILDLFNGLDQISGTNVRYHSKVVKTSTSKKEVQESNSQLGKDKNGQNKGKTCWDYVKHKKCEHCNESTESIQQSGQNINNRWHPSDEECQYLHDKKATH